MRNYEMLNRIYKAYNGYDVTYEEMMMNSRNFTDTVLQCYSYHLDEGDKYKYFAIFCAWVAASDGEPNRKEHEFFVRFSGINISYDAFKDTGIKAINNIKTCIELRDININKFRLKYLFLCEPEISLKITCLLSALKKPMAFSKSKVCLFILAVSI